MPREGPQALLERPGLALLGGLLLAGALVLCSVTAPSLRPRLAAVGGLLAIAVTVLAAGLPGCATPSPPTTWTGRCPARACSWPGSASRPHRCSPGACAAPRERLLGAPRGGDERIRVVIAGPGPVDGDRPAEIVARALRDAGMEVVYTDRPQTPEQLVATVVQEDADAVGVVVAGGDATPVHGWPGCWTSGGSTTCCSSPAAWIAGDVPGHGVARVFPRGAAPAEVVDWLREQLRS